MRKRGEVTIFLSMVLLCLLSLMCGLIESARMAGAQYYLKVAADSAIDSVFSGYHKRVWEDYRLFFLEYGETDELAASWREAVRPYEEDHGWYPFRLEEARTEELINITDNGGTYIKQEILDYMQYGIWDIDMDEAHAKEMLGNIKEAAASAEISKAYGEHTREAVRLEKALEDVAENLSRQKEAVENGFHRIAAWDGNGFRRAAKNLEREIDKLPGLVKSYGKRADQLAERMSETREKADRQCENLHGQIRTAMEEEMEAYESYVAKDGERRGEIEGLIQKEAGIRSVIDRAVERSYEVEEIIDDWEDSHDEDEDGPNEGALWQSVSNVWDDVEVPGLTCSFGVKDKQKERILEQIRQMADFDLLRLVVPKGEAVSSAVLDTTGFLAASTETMDKADTGGVERLLTDEYIGKFLTNFLSAEKKQVQYEQEYMIGGKNSDEENLKETVKSLLLVREGFNLVHILSDSEKRQEARALAGVITGAVGLAPLTEIVAFFIMTVWALGESFLDLRAMLEGKKVVLFKTKQTWKLTLEELLTLGSETILPETKEQEEGLDYGAYLKLLLFVQEPHILYYRLLNVITMNIRRQQPEFSVDHCAYGARIYGRAKTKHLFFAGNTGPYSMSVLTDKAY